jgi:UDP-MurNAc hydroxylase
MAHRQIHGIIVRYVYSASVVTSTPDVSILSDPWFTDGAYDGSWFQFPRLSDPIACIGNVDLIYISHIHPDHYDPKFIKNYFSIYGEKALLVAAHAPNYLVAKMRADGLTPTIVDLPMRIGQTTVEFVPHRTGSASDIDSAIIVRYDDGIRSHCVLNVNDIVFDAAAIHALKERVGDIDILLCGYTGAGPYPQTYFSQDDPRLPIEAEKKRQSFFDRYKRLTNALDAKANLPFAGKYILGGRLTHLNRFRGVADATEVLSFDRRAVVLADDGGTISTVDLKPSAVRTSAYAPHLLEAREREIQHSAMDYERLISEAETWQLPIKRTLVRASAKAQQRSECDHDYYLVFELPDAELAILDARRGAEQPIRFAKSGSELPTPRSEISIDCRYLFGLLTGIYHWNNAEVGSQYSTRRTPNTFDRKAQTYLNFLAV